MGLILLEALGALLALVLIVWWTMFSGRPGGEPAHLQHDVPDPAQPAETPEASGPAAPPPPPPSTPPAG